MATLYLDCDGFFAACEESADAALHGRPVAVSTIDPDNRAAVVIAVNSATKRRVLGKGRAIRQRNALGDMTLEVEPESTATQGIKDRVVDRCRWVSI